MVADNRERVRPRVVSPETGETLLLEDLLECWLSEGRTGTVRLVGGLGAGKTEALGYVQDAGRFQDRVALRDGGGSDGTRPAAGLLLTTEAEGHPDQRINLPLARWGFDEVLEYVQARYPSKAKTILSRLDGGQALEALQGVPLLLSLVIDGSAEERDMKAPVEFLRQKVEAMAGSPSRLYRVQDQAIEAAWHGGEPLDGTKLKPVLSQQSELGRWTLLAPIRELLATDGVLRRLASSQITSLGGLDLGAVPLDRLVSELYARPELELRLRHWMEQRPCASQRLVASLLHRMPAGWRPSDKQAPVLRAARLQGADWRQAPLAGADLRSVRLNRAQLGSADLVQADLRGAVLESADLKGAKLTEADLAGANLRGADLSGATADRASFELADLSGLRCELASFAGARFAGARLGSVRLERCGMNRAELPGVDLTGSEIHRSGLGAADLKDACLSGARWSQVILDLAFLDRADLTDADLAGVSAVEASFVGAGLSGVDLSGADLRRADFSHASFHLGSTRCGLLSDAPPLWGSRTGFYAAEAPERQQRDPVEFRKANLLGANLMGAKVQGADWYLVDLRGARYSREQARHFLRCRAIL